ncbi:hypothetical protein TKK_0013815 [Trichogramma kaykai]
MLYISAVCFRRHARRKKNVTGFKGTGLHPFNSKAVDYDILKKGKSKKKPLNEVEESILNKTKENPTTFVQQFEESLSKDVLEEFNAALISTTPTVDIERKELFKYWLRIRKVDNDKQNRPAVIIVGARTKLIHFNDRNIQPGSQRIKIREHVVSSSSHTKFLGVIFDYKLSFREHISYVKKKGTSVMNIMKWLCGRYCGSHPDTLLILYKSYKVQVKQDYYTKEPGSSTIMLLIEFSNKII